MQEKLIKVFGPLGKLWSRVEDAVLNKSKLPEPDKILDYIEKSIILLGQAHKVATFDRQLAILTKVCRNPGKAWEFLSHNKDMLRKSVEDCLATSSMNTCIRRQKGRNGVERSNPSWGPRWLEVPRLGETGGFHSASSRDGLSRLGAISSHALGVAKVVEQEGPVLQLQEAKAHPKEGMYLPLAFMDVNVKDSVGKVDSPEMVSSVPTVGIHARRELGSRGAVLSCKESIQVSRELSL